MIRRIIICDDSEEERRELAELAGEYYEGKAEISLCADGNELEQELRKGRADILLLDIEMPGENGIKIKERLEAAGTESYIVFVTSHMNFIQEAFGKNVMGYVQKPLEKDKLYNIFARINDNKIQNREIEVRTISEKVRKIALDHIRYIKVEGICSFIYTEDEIISVRKSLNQWEEELKEKYFVRINRSCLVNLRYVDKIRGRQIHMKDEEKVKDRKTVKKKKDKQIFSLTRNKEKKERIEELYTEYIRKMTRVI